MAHLNTLALGLEQGALALLGSRSSRALLRLATHGELILLTCALQAVAEAVPRAAPVVGRVSSLMAQVLATIALNAALDAVAVPRDPALTAANLLGIFFLGTATGQDDAGVTAQYLLVARLSDELRDSSASLLGGAWALAAVPALLPVGVATDLVQLARLVTVETLLGFLRAHLAFAGGLLAASLLLLYLIAPFAEQFPALARLNRFAVFAVANDPRLHGVPPWLLAAGLWGLWQADPEPTGRAFAASAGSSVAVLAALDAIAYAMDNDPAPVLVAMLIGLQILQR
jgi:hypothetical protein